jgi:hypothetical protein
MSSEGNIFLIIVAFAIIYLLLLESFKGRKIYEFWSNYWGGGADAGQYNE